MKNNDFFDKIKLLNSNLAKFDSLAIAFSGGVDSTFLLASAKKALGDNVFAIIAKTPVFPKDEEVDAVAFLKQENIRYSIISPDLMAVDSFVSNPKDRCYICKKILFEKIINEAEKQGICHLAHGVNTDDFSDYRPGLKAADELGVISPLADACLSKDEIRKASREMNLATADKSAMACLASRIPYGDIITVEKLQRIEKAENVLKKLGFEMMRVRYHGNVARIEVPEGRLLDIMEENMRAEVLDSFRALGFLYVSVDMAGYSQGSMNITA